MLIEFTLNGKTVQVQKGTTVYQAAKQLGIEIPIFCYHDRMPPFGACRVCLVHVEKMGKLQTSCTLEATEGMVVNTQNQLAIDGRKEILELLLINHPLDCPICDRGGECPLQDNVLKYGPGLSRFFEEKRKLKKAYPLGPVLKVDQERCIVCARCTRFGDELAGDQALTFAERGYRTVIETKDGKPVESKFIGNTIMICPVGALTSDVYRFRARPWDNDTTKTSCTLCPVGCSMKLDSRDGEIMRTRSVENPAVNDIWLCDKGWFGYEFTYHPERLKKPLLRKNGRLEEVSWEEAISLIASKVKEAKSTQKLAGIGGNPLTTEENYLFQKLVREGYGVNHVDHRVGMPIFSIEDEGMAPGMQMEIGDLEQASTVVLLGLDITEEFPILWLRLRQAINKGAHTIFIGHYAPEVARYFKHVITHPPGKELEMLESYLPDKNARVTFLLGNQYLASKNRISILSKLLEFKNSNLNLLEGRGNSMGARMAGMRPDVGPLGEKIESPGLDCLQLFHKITQEGWDLLHIAGSDPAIKVPSWSEIRKKLKFLIVQDLFLTKTAEDADVVLPTLAYPEKKGTFINIEGRPQHIRPGKNLPREVYSDGEIFLRVAQKLGISLIFEKNFKEALEQNFVRNALPKALSANVASVSEEPLLATFSHLLFDEGVRMEHNEHLRQLIKSPFIRIHPSEGAKRNIHDGDLVKINDIQAKVAWDDRVSLRTVVIPVGFKELPVYELSQDLINGLPINLERMN